MKFCIDCKHFEPAESLRWYDLFGSPMMDRFTHRFQDKCNNVENDRVTGKPRKIDAQWMRLGASDCGPDALLFEPKE